MTNTPHVPTPGLEFPSRANPHAADAERHALRWAERVGLADARAAAGLARQRFGLLAGRCHPDLGRLRLADVCRWYLWFAVLDDRYCDRHDGTASLRPLSARLAAVGQALAGSDPPPADPLVRAAADLGRRVRARATHEQYRRLLLGFQATYFGLLWELGARTADPAPTLDEYRWMRRLTGALPAFVTLTEVYSGRSPSAEQVARPDVQALVAQVGNLIMWQNDIRSYGVEAATGRPVLSLPTVLAPRGDPAGALDLAARMWHEEAHRYRLAREAVRRAGPPAVRRYADRLHDLLAGFLTWTYETTRYA
jgi:hypothetical protein